MTFGLTVVGASATILVLLVALFRVEETKGDRIALPRARLVFDKLVIWFETKFVGAFVHFGAGVFRTTLHYLIHQLLGAFIGGLTRMQHRLFHMQQRNKTIQQVPNDTDETTHLGAIAAHKEETSLTEAEKRKRKRH